MPRKRSLQQVIAEIGNADRRLAAQVARHAQRRKESVEEAQRLIAAGEKPLDPIATYALLFASSQGSGCQKAVVKKLHELTGFLKGKAGEPVLLVLHHRTQLTKGGCFHHASFRDEPEICLGVLDEGGPIFDFADPTKLALPTTKYVMSGVVADSSPDGKVQDGPLPIPGHFLAGLLELGGNGDNVDLAVGQFAFEACRIQLPSDGSNPGVKLKMALGLPVSEIERTLYGDK